MCMTYPLQNSIKGLCRTVQLNALLLHLLDIADLPDVRVRSSQRSETSDACA
jgi:hypothetical protein